MRPISRLGTTSTFSSRSKVRIGTASTSHKVAFLPSRHEVALDERPVTGTGGLATIKPHGKKKTAESNGRQTQDTSFFLGHLRTKENQIITEIEKLKIMTKGLEKECELMKDNQTIYQDLLIEVRELEGILADYNLAMDKARSVTDPEDISSFQKQMSLYNSKLAHDIDNIFITRQRKKKEISEIEKKIDDMHVSLQEKIQHSTDINKIQEYNTLMGSLQVLYSEGKEKEQEIDHLRKKIGELHMLMSQNEGQDLSSRYEESKQIEIEMKKKLSLIQEDVKIKRMNPETAHSYLLEKVKTNIGMIANIDSKKTELDKSIANLRKMKQEIQEIENPKSESGEEYTHSKLQRALKNQREIKDVLITKKSQLSDSVKEKGGLKSNILNLLQDLSEDIVLSTISLPSKDQMADMKENVSFRMKHLEASQQTIQILHNQRLKREKELARVENIEDKISKELELLKKNIEEKQQEIERFDSLDGLEDQSETAKDYLVQMRQRYTKRRNFMKLKVKEIVLKLEKNQEQLKTDDVSKSIEDLKKILSQHAETVFDIQNYLDTKGRQSEYVTIKKSCLDAMEDLSQSRKEKVLKL